MNEINTEEIDTQFIQLADPKKIEAAGLIFKDMCKREPKRKLPFDDSSDEDEIDAQRNNFLTILKPNTITHKIYSSTPNRYALDWLIN